MLDWGYVRVSPDGIGAMHVASCVKQAGEGMFESNYVPGHCIKERVGSAGLGFWGLRTDQSWGMEGLTSATCLGAFRDDLGLVEEWTEGV